MYPRTVYLLGEITSSWAQELGSLLGTSTVPGTKEAGNNYLVNK